MSKWAGLASIISAAVTVAIFIGGLFAYFGEIAVTTDRVGHLYKEVLSPEDSSRSLPVRLANISSTISSMNNEETGIPDIRRKVSENRDDIFYIRGSLDTNFPKIIVDKFEDRLNILEGDNAILADQVKKLQTELSYYKNNIAGAQNSVSYLRDKMEKEPSVEEIKSALEGLSDQLKTMQGPTP